MKHINKFSVLVIILAITAAASCNNGRNCCRQEAGNVCNISGTADKIVFGNIITMDSRKMHAEAMTIKNGLVQYVGSKKVAESLCDANTVREDYGDASVYPGFIDTHTHPLLAGQRRMQIDLVSGVSADDFLAIIKEYVDKNPDLTIYKGAGWSPCERELLAKDLDAICSDKPIILNSIDGHSYWLNSLALKQYGFTPEVAKEDGPALVHQDADGNPSGVVVEESERIASHAVTDLNEEKQALLIWQDFAFQLGFTTVGDAGFGSDVDLQAYKELEDEGKFKLFTYCSYYQPVPGQPVEEKVAKTVKAREQYSGHFFKVSGIKMFVDGVVEGHTAWLLDEYTDQPGYTGVKKLDDHGYLVDLVKTANENGLYVHLHTIGDGAVKFAVDAIEEAQKLSGIYNAHNCMAHLQILRPEDIQRMADNNIVAIVAPLWVPYDDTVSPLEDVYLGKERTGSAYPIRSFLDAGAVVTFHSDYPVSTEVSVPRSIVCAVLRGEPGVSSRQREKEGLSRLQALEAMTVSPAYALDDTTIGSLESGKKANYTVFDADFLNDTDLKIINSTAIATAIEGDIVYKSSL